MMKTHKWITTSLYLLVFLLAGCSSISKSADVLSEAEDSAKSAGIRFLKTIKKASFDIGLGDTDKNSGSVFSFGMSGYPAVGDGLGIHLSMDQTPGEDPDLESDYQGLGLGTSYLLNDAVGVYAGASLGRFEAPTGEKDYESGFIFGVQAFVTDFKPLNTESVVVGAKYNSVLEATTVNIGLEFKPSF